MSRDLFRGKPTKETVFGTDFVHGDLIRRGVHAYILPKTTICAWSPEGELTTTPIEVHPDTVGQYTGKKFEDKTEVYLGDFAQEYKDGPIWEIIWDDIFSGFRMRNWLDMENTVPDYANVLMCEHCKKVGTIYDKEQQ